MEKIQGKQINRWIESKSAFPTTPGFTCLKIQSLELNLAAINTSWVINRSSIDKLAFIIKAGMLN